MMRYKGHGRQQSCTYISAITHVCAHLGRFSLAKTTYLPCGKEYTSWLFAQPEAVVALSRAFDPCTRQQCSQGTHAFRCLCKQCTRRLAAQVPVLLTCSEVYTLERGEEHSNSGSTKM